MPDETMVDLGGGMVVPISEVTCCNGVDDVCVSSGCILGIPGGERGDVLECNAEGCACHDQ